MRKLPPAVPEGMSSVTAAPLAVFALRGEEDPYETAKSPLMGSVHFERTTTRLTSAAVLFA